ncbi:ankyrin repeat [Fusarium beomiforme]|uniref:Ankyrin repeat n=1 Tax=Fusarium beomiforme TaxID=44412 RepID=A0A9P5DY65_9HYPO|nr:ankyrin repeat [Fusarium beomiforme]
MSGYHGWNSCNQYDSDKKQDSCSQSDPREHHSGPIDQSDEHHQYAEDQRATYIRKAEECLKYYGATETQESYRDLANAARDTLLEETGTKGVVTCRTKTHKSLETKLQGMESDTEFTSFAIKNNILEHHEMGDLGAVRIGLYQQRFVLLIFLVRLVLVETPPKEID